MRLLGVLFGVCILGAVSNAYAYKEIYSDDETQVTAGDQNTNMYRLNSMGSLAMKRLKKIDDALARNPTENITASDISQIEELIDSQDNESKRFLERMQKQITKTLATTQDLTIKNDALLYRELNAISYNSTRDAAVASALLQQLARRR